jgi:3-hydroxyacyl-[acyl-carrier-protein] dehydratase
LLNDLYIIKSMTTTENQIQVVVELKAEHAIFKGHFPGQPVLPGVSMMQMIAEITGEYLKQPFRITGAPMVKFLHTIDPRRNPLINLEIKYESIPSKTIVSGKIFFGAEVFMKFQVNLEISSSN